jgi:hypothetical protein
LGNVVVAGETNGWLATEHVGGYDAFVRKYDAVGREVWTLQFGTNVDDYATGVAVDGAGNVLVVGDTYGSLAEDNIGGDSDVFVRKYDATGEESWTRQFGTHFADRAFGVAVDAATSIFVAGCTNDLLAVEHFGGYDPFVRKYDADGHASWTRQFGTGANDRVSGVAADGSASVVVAGVTLGSLAGPSAGDADAFVRKLTP